jgi:hypothetical protein
VRMVCLACSCNRGSRLAFRLRPIRRQQWSTAISPGDAVRQPSQCKLRFRRGRFDHDSKRNIIECQLGFGDRYTSDHFQQLLQRFGHGLPHDSSAWPERTGSNSVRASTGRQYQRDIISRKQCDGRHGFGDTHGHGHRPDPLSVPCYACFRRRLCWRHRDGQHYRDQHRKWAIDDFFRKSFRIRI